MIKKIIHKIIPQRLWNKYHLVLAVLANIIYRFPSRELVVIGVTGTKGKSTTSNMIWKILTEAGHKTGMTTTANFRIGEKEWINNTKMTMQGRFKLQKLLRQMVAEGCEYAVVETASEGILQYRHWGIKYQIAVFTNLTPEHLERHGGFENYKRAKGELFKNLSGKSIIVANLDDKHVDYFLSFPAYEHITYGFNRRADIVASEAEANEQGNYFLVNSRPAHVPVKGGFNQYNALAAIATARALRIEWEVIIKAIKGFVYMPGRMEEFISTKGFRVYVDYAHTAESLEAVYKSVKPFAKRLIAVHGATGGGRDKKKRPIMGRLSGEYADIVIVTDEDPYTEDPEAIIDQVLEGVKQTQTKYYRVVDRKEAIKKAMELAQEGDVITVTGKGSETVMAVKQGMIPWSDREIVKEYL